VITFLAIRWTRRKPRWTVHISSLSSSSSSYCSWLLYIWLYGYLRWNNNNGLACWWWWWCLIRSTYLLNLLASLCPYFSQRIIITLWLQAVTCFCCRPFPPVLSNRNEKNNHCRLWTMRPTAFKWQVAQLAPLQIMTPLVRKLCVDISFLCFYYYIHSVISPHHVWCDQQSHRYYSNTLL